MTAEHHHGFLRMFRSMFGCVIQSSFTYHLQSRQRTRAHDSLLTNTQDTVINAARAHASTCAQGHTTGVSPTDLSPDLQPW